MNLRPGTLAAFCGVVAMAAVCLTGCSPDEDEDRSAVASAKCSLPVYERAGFSTMGTSTSAEKEDVAVTSLGKGSYRVTGRVVGHEEDGQVSSFNFICEVAPDSSDKLRGFKVTSLTVTPQ